MQLNEKLQKLRKEKGLTQEELAESLYVSRTAISKWESGRGYPNIDSLKAIASFFSVTIDDLLSSEQLLTIAEADSKQKARSLRNLVFGLLDLSIALFFFLPIFGQKTGESIQEVPLLSLSAIAPYLKTVYFVLTLAVVAFGVLTLALQTFHHPIWEQCKGKISFLLSAIGTLLFTVSLQPYAAAFLFAFLMIKVLTLIKQL